MYLRQGPANSTIAWLSGYGYDEQGPHLVVDYLTAHGPARYFWNLLDTEVSIQRLKGRHCTGLFDLTDLKSAPCPEARPVLATSRTTCESCHQSIGFNPFFYNVPRENLSDKQRTYNESAHCVYLAYFGGDVVKVGISSQKRTLTRLLEQGSWAAVIVMTCRDAWEARRFEHEISQMNTFAETVRSKRKRELLCVPTRFDRKQAYEVLTAARYRLIRGIGLQTDSNVIHLDEKYGTLHAGMPAVDMSERTPLLITGTPVAMIGPALFVLHRDQLFVFDVGKIKGHRFRFTAGVYDGAYSSVQQSLL